MSDITRDNPAGNIFETSKVCMAPMAGYSDAPFRLICSDFGADFCVTEMVSSDGLIRRGDKTVRILERFEGEAPLGIQLFGSDPRVMGEAAAVAASFDPAFIDLNFGCPVKKVVRKNGGSAIMRDLGLMERLCASAVQASGVPVSAKIRSGWSAVEENYLEAGKVVEDAGCVAVTLHPRFRTQGFSGEADWSHIARLREALTIPVIANGDVRLPEDYLKIVDATGCSLVMIGRGAFGRPWIFREIKQMLEATSGQSSTGPVPDARVSAGPVPDARVSTGPVPDARVSADPVPDAKVSADRLTDGQLPGYEEMPLSGRIDVLERLFRLEAEWKGERLGVLETRKFCRWFLRGHPGMKKYRTSLSTVLTLDEVTEQLNALREEIEQEWTRAE